MASDIEPLNGEELKFFWKQVKEYKASILGVALRSDLYHRAMLAKAEHQLQHNGQSGSCSECKTTDQWILAEVQRLGIELK
jgi:hypothetical protein